MSNWKRNKQLAVFTNTQPTMTDQSMREGTDINVIVRNIALAGQYQGNARQPKYGDFTDIPDNLHDAHQMIRDLEQTHAKLPLELRQYTPKQLAAMDNNALSQTMATAKTVQERRKTLPPNFARMTDESIMALTAEQLTNIITPPPPVAKQTEATK